MSTRPLSVFGAIAAGMLICLGTLGAAIAQDDQQDDEWQTVASAQDGQVGPDEQSGAQSDETGNPPGRAAQLSYAEGSVSLEPAGTSIWTGATLNRPLTLGDKLWTDQSSRAELDIGDAVIRLGSTTGFSFLNLDEQTAQMQVTAGTVIVHVRSLASGEQDEIDTPNLALTLEQPGTYRVEVSDTGDTTIVEVEDGEALATGGGQSYPVAAQQSATFTGTSTLAADYASLGAPDSLDDWSMQRDQQERQQSEVAQQYVPPETVGADDLGSYGSWESTPDWGYAWFPSVAAGWAPYSLGNWVWVSPWGWTWVDAEPWGFAPFHYGRWGYWQRRWCWIPGPRRKRPVYAPALVGWVGGRYGGPRGAIGPHVGWFPLGPHDVYVPGYHSSAAYVRNINVTNTRLVDPTEIGRVYAAHAGNVRYANSEVPGAVTAVPRNVFTSAQPVGPHRVILPHQTLAGLQFMTAAPAIIPVRQSVLGAHAGRVVRTPPRTLIDRPVVARIAPPRAPVSFVREQAAIRANGGRPLPAAELARLRPNIPAAPVRLVRPPARGRQVIELHTAPENRAAQFSGGMSARERALQQPALPPARAPRSDRPNWAQQQPIQPRSPIERPYPQRQGPLRGRMPPPQRQVVPQRQAPQVERFAPPPRQVPVQRLAPQRQAPERRFAPPPRQVPEFRTPAQRFAAPLPQAPEQRFTTPERQMPEQRFTPPPQVPRQHFNPPERQIPQERATAPRYNRPPEQERQRSPPPMRPVERRSEGRPPA